MEMIAAWVEGELRPLDKLEVHRRGLRHPAVSVFLTSARGILLQQRAAGKYHSALLWANACCTHPHWGEAPSACAERRLAQELGVTGLTLQPRGGLHYRAEVPPDLIEDEEVEVFLAEVPGDLGFAPDPAEVAALRWVQPAALEAEIAAEPAAFTPWLRIYLRKHRAQILGA